MQLESQLAAVAAIGTPVSLPHRGVALERERGASGLQSLLGCNMLDITLRAPARAWLPSFGASERAGLGEPRCFRSFASAPAQRLGARKVHCADDFRGQVSEHGWVTRARSRQSDCVQPRM
jgi:hypothetical protein